MLKMESKPRNQLRDWHKRMRQAWRSTGHQTRDVETEEEDIPESIKEDAKALGKERFGSKGTVNHLHEHKSLLTSIPKHFGESVGMMLYTVEPFSVLLNFINTIMQTFLSYSKSEELLSVGFVCV